MNRTDALAAAEQSHREARETEETRRRIEEFRASLDPRRVIRDQPVLVTLRERVPAYLPNRHRVCPACGDRRSSHCKTDVISPARGMTARAAMPFRKLAQAIREGRDLRRHGALTNRVVIEQALCGRCETERDRREIAGLAQAYRGAHAGGGADE